MEKEKMSQEQAPFEIKLETGYDLFPRIRVILKNISSEEQTYLCYNPYFQMELVIIEKTSGKEIHGFDVRAKEKFDNTLYPYYYEKLKHGEEKVIKEGTFEANGEGGYAIGFGPYDFKDIRPGEYTAYVVFKSRYSDWYDRDSNQRGKIEGIWLGEIKSNKEDIRLLDEKNLDHEDVRFVISFSEPYKNEEGITIFNTFLEDYEKKIGVNLTYSRIDWKDHNEQDYLFRLEELKKSEQEDFIKQVKELFENNPLVTIMENVYLFRGGDRYTSFGRGYTSVRISSYGVVRLAISFLKLKDVSKYKDEVAIFEDFLEDYEKKTGVNLTYNRVGWKDYNELDWVFQLEELKENKQEDFIKQVKELFENNPLVKIREDIYFFRGGNTSTRIGSKVEWS